MTAELEQIRDAALAGNTTRAIELLKQSPDPAAAIAHCIELLRDLHWKEKNLQAVLALGKAGIAVALAAAKQNPTHSPGLQRQARIISYNIASFAWPGWNEPGITPGPAEQAVGRAMAEQHLTMVAQHEPVPIILSNAHWLVGAFDLNAGDYAAARNNFNAQVTYAREARSEAEDLLGQAYATLTDILLAPTHESRNRLNQIKTAFRSLKDGDEYVRQLETAESVFERKSR